MGIVSRVLITDPLAAVGGAVIDKDDLKIGICLGQKRIDTFMQIRRNIIDWDDDRYFLLFHCYLPPDPSWLCDDIQVCSVPVRCSPAATR